jgi:hypothetical protein
MTDVRSRRGGWWFAIPVGIALLAAGGYVGRTWVRPTAKATSDGERSKRADDERIESLEREMRRLREVVAMQAAQAAAHEQVVAERMPRGEHEWPDDPAPREPPTPAEPHEDEGATRAAQRDFWDGLAERAASEPRDARFSNETEPLITQLLSHHLGANVTVSDVACASSICRAKVTHPDSPRLAEARLADFMLQRDSLASMSVQLDLREEGVTMLYFMRGDAE